MDNIANPSNPVSVEPVASPEEQARARAQECSNAIAQLLERYKCSIVPYITAEQVGPSHLPPTKVLTVAAYAIIPQF